jgi:hypothetical protein
VGLAGVLVEIARAHARCERLADKGIGRGSKFFRWRRFRRLGKQIISCHASKLPPSRMPPKRKNLKFERKPSALVEGISARHYKEKKPVRRRAFK